MEIIHSILDLLFWILGIYLLLNCAYLGIFGLVGLLPLRKSKKEASRYRKIALLFPTYQENIVIIDSVKTALQHQYNGVFEVVVIA
ncbi:hypothetical protein, partial [Pedobacter sp.]